ncbi:2'-5' RNA ligase family protein [Ochrobactrum sp. Marseille-Q0166]|uniref:2'-5' RNA ligase family protein n=1 Tax=Ochrobactrum sp. Marseille-Q0166 TaxID=2761105 RepID=UPI0016563E09|nr:2'-5' RNA ligase family protein [Ochrobactrum sp. Marseille-Q0166]MBC8719246.1 2'-5' RNA ligase family protein [Ochrobactrum sp. Marseille-Q0166]
MSDHSIWLRPAQDDLVFLEKIVRDLSERFNSPVFEPHITLVPDMKRSAEELLPQAISLAIGRKPLELLIENVTGSEAYFRSFYAALEKAPALMRLKQDTLEISGDASLQSFMPHVSLAYGVDDSTLKHAEIQRLAKELSGRKLKFDRLVIVSSSSETPIDDWIVKHEIYLKG